MRVICPYEPAIHPLCEAALDKYAPGAERRRLGPSPTAYWELLCELWGRAESFILIEHDVQIHEMVLPELENCFQPWCAFPYGGPPPHIKDTEQVLFKEALGCTRFSASLMRDEPQMVAKLGVGMRDVERYHQWRGLDGHIGGALRGLGYDVHNHWPKVTHHHLYAAGCSCGDNH